MDKINITFRAIGPGEAEVFKIASRELKPEEFIEKQGTLASPVKGGTMPKLDPYTQGHESYAVILMIPANELPKKFQNEWNHSIAVPHAFFNQFKNEHIRVTGDYAKVITTCDENALFEAWKQAGYPTFWGFDKSDKSIQTVKKSTPKTYHSKGVSLKRALRALKSMHSITQKTVFTSKDYTNGANKAKLYFTYNTRWRYLNILIIKGYVTRTTERGKYTLTSKFLNLR
jgi:hypothetical protein